MNQLPKEFTPKDEINGTMDFVVNIPEIKFHCMHLAIESNKHDINYDAAKMVVDAKEIFDWIMDDDGFEKQT